MSDSVWKNRHALTVLWYYIVGFAGVVIVSHPVYLLCVWGVLTLVEITQTGFKRSMRGLFTGIIPGVIVILFNMLINHRGPTTLFILGEIRFTLEAFLFGCRMALMLLIAIRFFMQFSRAMTEEKIMSLMAKHLPGIALLFSMILRLVPMIHRDAGQLKKFHGRGPKVWRKLLSMTMEDGIIRSISMRERGYGSENKRTVIYRKGFCMIDIAGLLMTLLWGAWLIYEISSEGIITRYYPSFYMCDTSIVILLLWAAFYAVPLLMKGREVFAWQRSKRRIIDTGMPMKQERL